MSAMFSALSVKNYRIYAAGALVSNTGTWMGRVAQDWVVLTELTDNSAAALGIVTGLQFLPTVLLTPLAGALSDAFSKRKVMLVSQSFMAFFALLMGVWVLHGSMELWHMYVLATLSGVASAVDAPARQAFVSEMVPKEKLTNAVGLNSASFHFGRLLGPATAGLLIAAFSTGPTLIINAFTFIAVIIALLMMDTRLLAKRPDRTGKGRAKISEGVRYVARRPDIILIMIVAFMHGTFGMNFQITNALMATEIYGKGVEEYGITGSVMAIGSLAGALMAARRERPRWRLLLGSLGLFAIFSFFLAMAPTFAVYTVLLVPTGLTALTVMVSANAMVQLSVDQEVRGRVMALYMAVFFGGTPIGSPIIGWVGETFGARWTILIATIACGLTAAAAIIYLMRHDNLRLRIRASWARPLYLERGPALTEPIPEKVT
ncbi:MFS transporter [Ornithinimicrobium humiphilum]|uniref:Putative MFS family arabinose efflux permease n=1 Tax=Ornithinimicrobium humiphilum TaxID=125288 RepID=A0A543KKM8_9MICO|nr:MFS transporter [Ornithinimicrobium humiphilum]TQM95626.1 putative MFS family arabinose efflux permease [Ornithinimicrobium humiphilum]